MGLEGFWLIFNKQGEETLSWSFGIIAWQLPWGGVSVWSDVVCGRCIGAAAVGTDVDVGDGVDACGGVDASGGVDAADGVDASGAARLGGGVVE